MFLKYLVFFTFTLCRFWRVAGYTAEEDAKFKEFVKFGLALREKFFEFGGEQSERKSFGSTQFSEDVGGGEERKEGKVFEARGRKNVSRQRRQTRSGPGFYALPLPYLPQVIVR